MIKQMLMAVKNKIEKIPQVAPLGAFAKDKPIIFYSDILEAKIWRLK